MSRGDLRRIAPICLLLSAVPAARGAAAPLFGGVLYGDGAAAEIRHGAPVLAAGNLLGLTQKAVRGSLQLKPRLDLGPVAVTGDLWLEGAAAQNSQPSWSGQVQNFKVGYTPVSEWPITLGIQVFHYGSAYVWNPSNPFTDPEMNNADRTVPYHREGDPFITIERLGEKDNLAVQATQWLPTDRLYGPGTRRESSLALRWTHVFDSADLVVVAADRDGEWFVSLAGALTLGERLELHAEATAHDRRRTLLPIVQTLNVPGGSAYYYRLAASGRSQTEAQAVIGGQYTFANQTNVILEYLYNGEGYSNAEFDTLNQAVTYSAAAAQSPLLGLANRGFLASVAQISGRMRRHYLFGRVMFPDLIGDLDLHLFTRWGLADGASVSGILAKLPLTGAVELDVGAEYYGGPPGSEGALIPYRWNASLALSLRF